MERRMTTLSGGRRTRSPRHAESDGDVDGERHPHRAENGLVRWGTLQRQHTAPLQSRLQQQVHTSHAQKRGVMEGERGRPGKAYHG